MINDAMREVLKQGGYKLVGEHGAVRLCHWNRAAIKTGAMCYKSRWYGGFDSHRCLQMTPTEAICTQRCRFCWCPLPADFKIHDSTSPMSGQPDDPEDLLLGCMDARRTLLEEAQAELKTSAERYDQALSPTHVGICLSGEPTLYPLLSELLGETRRMGMTSHLVTNGTMPEKLEGLKNLPTHLFVSLYAPDRETYLRTCRPLISGGWEMIQRTVQLLPSLSCKYTLELTVVKGLNMIKPREYSKLIASADPDSVDVKPFQRAGSAIGRTREEEVPTWDEVKEFASAIAAESGYRIGAEMPPFVILLTRN